MALPHRCTLFSFLGTTEYLLEITEQFLKQPMGLKTGHWYPSLQKILYFQFVLLTGIPVIYQASMGLCLKPLMVDYLSSRETTKLYQKTIYYIKTTPILLILQLQLNLTYRQMMPVKY